MEPLEILEEIKKNIKEKFERDPLIMRVVNMVIEEYKLRSKITYSQDELQKS